MKFVSILLVGVLLSLGLVAEDASARTVRYRSWSGYTICYSYHWKRAHPRRDRCRRHHSREYRKRHRAIHFARTKVGYPYVWGGTGPYGYDCSGLIYAAYRRVGRYIPRTTYAQLRSMRGKHRYRRPGDLVFAGPGHVALYIGRGRVIEAPHTGARIRYASSYRFWYAVRSPY